MLEDVGAAWGGTRKVRKLRLGLHVLLRAVGLELINVLARTRSRLYATEPKKKIIYKSRWTALVRCAVHILPTFFSIALITLNLKHYYIGRALMGVITNDSINFALLQVAAKVQELLITASLATVIFQIIRNELMYGDGVPLGLLGSGFAFTDISYFWSPDFWCSLPYKAKLWKKCAVVGTLVMAGFLALTAGPACAVLLIPRLQAWDAGGSSFYLNGSYDEIWPSLMTFDSKGSQAYCTSDNATAYGVCPSGDFDALWNHYHSVNVSSFMGAGTKLPYAANWSGSAYFYEIGSPKNQIPVQLTLGNIRKEGGAAQSFLLQSHAATAVQQQQLTIDWYNAAQNVSWTSLQNIARYHYAPSIRAFTETRVPSVGVQCSNAQKLVPFERSVQFPVDNFSWRHTRGIDVSSLNDSMPDHVRFSWFILPDTSWGDSTTGAILEMPGSPEDGSRVVVGCTVRASWVIATSVHGDPDYIFSPTAIIGGTDIHIKVNESWLDALTPKAPTQGTEYYGFSPNTMEAIILGSGVGQDSLTDSSDTRKTPAEVWNGQEFEGGGNRTTFLESMVASHFADGLSRTRADRAFNTAGEVSTWGLYNYNRIPDYNQSLLEGRRSLIRPDSGNFTELRVNMTIDGYSFKATETTDFLSIAVLAVHMLIAFGHTMWCLWNLSSSECWDTVTEVITLSQNSQPAFDALKNTAAGVKKFSTFSQKAVVRVTRLPGHEEADHVDLLFEENKGPLDVEMQPQPKRSRSSSQTPMLPMTHSRSSSAAPSIDIPNVEGSPRLSEDSQGPNAPSRSPSPPPVTQSSEANDAARLSVPSQRPYRPRATSSTTLLPNIVGRSSGVEVIGMVKGDELYG